ncbi:MULTISPECIES: TetR/AcrR family transcriptional regulator [Serratia]|uniref:Bacterial regulatory proteins, tetR family n=2 Tax=Serratia ficaria TaxID=61651 RepID=A0A240CFT6_SERFI|nr:MULTISPECIES: TetR/AcrR family transcriptional regulator [Serratia]REF42367.1 TetR family transcriptional regulator [Serratia ficaria]CAI0990271.1 Bacterial regulatory proteins, tetR family [Serratia ficaria]CAI1182102.1 Bacterial regulatory proteins, tetR family [Serratia ficaria]CAI1183280.1 Bacterial regulatory proteins, tetR family [Serratia ficaria]CAI1200513.1 Bacterial regulatory proteins, tetR family [Serratia ficaria]
MPITAFPEKPEESLTSARAKTHRLLLTSAMALYNEGAFPSITEVAAHAQVSRATAYRYFPTQSALIAAVVAESLGPILEWRPQDNDALKRIQQLLAFAYPQMERHEGALRAALQLSLQQWANATPGEKLVRGNRKRLLKLAVEPLQDKLPADALQRVIHSFSLIYGSEVFLVLKDIWGLELDGIQEVTQWMAKAIIRQAEEDAMDRKKTSAG